MKPATIPAFPPMLQDEITNAVSETEQHFVADVSTTMKNFKDELQVEGLAKQKLEQNNDLQLWRNGCTSNLCTQVVPIAVVNEDCEITCIRWSWKVCGWFKFCALAGGNE